MFIKRGRANVPLPRRACLPFPQKCSPFPPFMELVFLAGLPFDLHTSLAFFKTRSAGGCLRKDPPLLKSGGSLGMAKPSAETLFAETFPAWAKGKIFFPNVQPTFPFHLVSAAASLLFSGRECCFDLY